MGHHARPGLGRANRVAAGVPLHPSFAYEIAFHARAFAVLWFWLRRRSLPPGETFVWYVAAYGVFRFLVEFVRGNDVAWAGLTRPQLFLPSPCRSCSRGSSGRSGRAPIVTPAAPRELPGDDERAGCRCAATASTATSTRSARSATRSGPTGRWPRCSGSPGWLVEREDRIWLERGCATHGLVRTLYDESPEILRYLEQWTAPTKRHEPDVRGNFKPVPAAYADGLPEMQTQHTCILLEDLLDHCNLKCPTCFAESSPARASVAPLEQVLASIDTRLSRENGRIDVLMLSGGEPTLYP